MYLKANAFLQIGKTIIEFDTYNFSWVFNVDDDDKPNYLEVVIPNLSKEFRNAIIKGTPVIFSFGYYDNSETIFQGYVDTYKTSLVGGITNQTTIKALSIGIDAFEMLSYGFAGENKTSEIIKILANKYGFIIEQLELKNDISHKNGYVAIGKFINVIRTLVEPTGSILQAEGNILTIVNPDTTEKTGVKVIEFDSNLLEEPKVFEENAKEYTHKVKVIAQATFRKNTIFFLKSQTVAAYVKIIKYTLTDFIGEYFVSVVEV